MSLALVPGCVTDETRLMLHVTDVYGACTRLLQHVLSSPALYQGLIKSCQGQVHNKRNVRQKNELCSVHDRAGVEWSTRGCVTSGNSRSTGSAVQNHCLMLYKYAIGSRQGDFYRCIHITHNVHNNQMHCAVQTICAESNKKLLII